MKKICFRVDANQNIGQGHAARCLAVANELSSNYDAQCLFAVSDEDSERFFAMRKKEVINLGLAYKDYSLYAAKSMAKIIETEQASIVIADSYYVTYEYLSFLRQFAKIGCFYCENRVMPVDLLINYNVDYDKSFYERNYDSKNVELLLGTEYVPLRKEFGKPKLERNNTIEKILFLTGGGDPLNVVESVVKEIKSRDDLKKFKFTFVIGTYSEIAGHQACKNEDDHITYMASTDKIADVMKAHDLVVSAGGTTMYELCALGIPSVIYSMVDNQISEAKYLGENGYLVYAGDVRTDNFFEKLLDSILTLASLDGALDEMSSKMRTLVDGKGCSRIASKIYGLKVG
ncbi:MAG TPA: UDP-2,4-diacetamido-2,4,6-trideoxy-beta-L-altropyranose hydrolase [Acetivibrio sp.]|uniref:UDP-2,4-diacetamido-2,4, 6-trideoxy-beta-L-altropyranose hydrolase n=1 Tax=Acetivibrio sp. TaxID=1872092 RepID=UPI002CD5E614|nr:UDP-2,4-diacetamido-2,4,6-trideoxy-beta-L-altropyranose hydrolase [Acetivibrio sp.]HOM01297.1 UDP-2,4-diacetamido-2,4,6-trideoxy-beta-L-altropyranose hydrolase [Acetivibrio sp.]